ncbi:unnamed protein product [Auanema sp. JU1783]|nr:unnamed protein product [Auanema sp. JU1783]
MNVEAGAQSNPDEGEAMFGKDFTLEFSQLSIRRAFIRRVFILVSIMFLTVTIMCAIPMSIPGVKQWYLDNGLWIYIPSAIVFVVFSLLMSCVTSIRRSFPANMICLAIFTLAAGLMVSAITVTYTVQSVLLALAITTACSASVVIFAIFIKKDLTSMMGIAFLLGICLFFYGIVAIIACVAFNVTFLYTIYALLGSLLFMFYLAIDVQLLMGNRRYSISPEEHVFAAMNIFLDILNIFLLLLSVIGEN